MIRRYKGFWILLVFLVLWIAFIRIIPPKELVSVIGVETGYLFVFLTALVGVSGFASAPYYATLITLMSTGDFNILLLALVVAPACALGDSLFFLLGYKGNAVIESRYLDKFSCWLNKKPYWVTPFAAYMYSSFAPLPQDFLMVALGLGRARFLHIIGAVALGNATFVLVIYVLLFNFVLT